MSDTAIVVTGVSKKYRLFNNASERLREALHPFSKRYHREFWALKGVSFQVPRGQTLGIVGLNGSGKSTLLQLIAGVMKPNGGEVIVNGRVSALLELGAGFNPEFTGRENVTFQAQVIGLSREEINRRLPEIEAFADIGEFFDQPVKTYSSGMFVRVAFAAAINVDPDVLIIDEALAVGDAKFQHRCFQKIREFQERGMTIILVTHAVDLVIRHCSRAIFLSEGRLIADGVPEVVARHYIDLLEGRDPSPTLHEAVVPSVVGSGAASMRRFCPVHEAVEAVNLFLVERPVADQCSRRATYNPGEYVQKDPRAEIVDYLIVSGDRVDPAHLFSGAAIDIYFKVRFYAEVKRPCFGIGLKTKDGLEIYGLNSVWMTSEPTPARAGDFRIAGFHLSFALNSGDVFLEFGLDESYDAKGYTNICRRMALVHLVVHSNTLFHGLADLDATFSDRLVDGKALLQVSGRVGASSRE